MIIYNENYVSEKAYTLARTILYRKKLVYTENYVSE